MNKSRRLRPTPDWAKLPAEFAYLTKAAERYGGLIAPGGIVHRRLRASEVEELSSLARQIGWNNHALLLQSWVIQRSRLKDEGSYEVRLVEGLTTLMDNLGLDLSDQGPKEDPQWTLRMWEILDFRLFPHLVQHTREVLSESEAFEVVVNALNQVPRQELSLTAFLSLHPFRTSRALGWIEAHISEVVSREDWPHLAAVSEISWPRIHSWVQRGRPLSLLALDTLINLAGESGSPVVKKADPKLLEPVPFDEAAQVLRNYAATDPVPRVERAVESILKRWSQICGRGHSATET